MPVSRSGLLIPKRSTVHNSSFLVHRVSFAPMPIMTGLSGNEIFCLNLKGFTPGELVIGNSVFSMGFLGSLGSIGCGLLGGEVPQITSVIHDGRIQAYTRMITEAEQRGGVGVTGVTNELRTFHGSTEFLSVASTVHS